MRDAPAIIVFLNKEKKPDIGDAFLPKKKTFLRFYFVITSWLSEHNSCYTLR